MGQGKGIREGDKIPDGYIAVPTAPNARCRHPECGAEYVIVYLAHEVDIALAKQHAAFLSGYLTGEHVDPKHAHIEEYGPLDWTDSE